MKNKPVKKCDRCGENEARVMRGTEHVCFTCSREIDREIAEWAEDRARVGKLIKAANKVLR